MNNQAIFSCRTFNDTNHFQFVHLGPISADTIVKLHVDTGEILDSWGSILFYVPHGMTIDHHGNTWVTDVALHQVFKFHPNSKYPALTIGRRFQPGSLPNHLCQPTAVAVASTGEVIVAISQHNTSLSLDNSFSPDLADFHRRRLLQQSDFEVQCGRTHSACLPAAT